MSSRCGAQLRMASMLQQNRCWNKMVLRKKQDRVTGEVLKLCNQHKELRAKLEVGQGGTLWRNRSMWRGQVDAVKGTKQQDFTRRSKKLLRRSNWRSQQSMTKMECHDWRWQKKKARWKEYFSELYNVHSSVDTSMLGELPVINILRKISYWRSGQL